VSAATTLLAIDHDAGVLTFLATCQRRTKIRQFRWLKIRQIDEGTSRSRRRRHRIEPTERS